LDTTTVLLLDVDPQSLHFEDDAVVFSSHHGSRSVAAPECLHSYLLPLLWPGFYTTSRDSIQGLWAVHCSAEEARSASTW
jgi:hypothetical protein